MGGAVFLLLVACRLYLPCPVTGINAADLIVRLIPLEFSECRSPERQVAREEVSNFFEMARRGKDTDFELLGSLGWRLAH